MGRTPKIFARSAAGLLVAAAAGAAVVFLAPFDSASYEWCSACGLRRAEEKRAIGPIRWTSHLQYSDSTISSILLRLDRPSHEHHWMLAHAWSRHEDAMGVHLIDLSPSELDLRWLATQDAALTRGFLHYALDVSSFYGGFGHEVVLEGRNELTADLTRLAGNRDVEAWRIWWREFQSRQVARTTTRPVLYDERAGPWPPPAGWRSAAEDKATSWPAAGN